jgi:hypothetical protein
VLVWVHLVGRYGCKLYIARKLVCYEGWHISDVLKLSKDTCEAALSMWVAARG